MTNNSETVLEIDLSALEHNYNFFKSLIQPSTKFLAVVKAYAYGSDAIQIAKKLESLKVDYFAVAYVNEGVQLRDAGITTPILVLHPQPSNFEVLIHKNLEPNLYSHRTLELFLKLASEKQLENYPVHLKFNTGLNRLGFEQKDITKVSKTLSSRDVLKVVSIFTHLAASEDLSEKDFTLKQIESFNKISKEFYKKYGIEPFRHILNTSGIINYTDAQLDMVRSGIGLYGYGNTAEIDCKLQPVVSLKTTISQIHIIKPNQSVGYNRKYISNKDQKIATLPLGHADGIGRQYGNGQTFVLVNGKKAFIIGNVCMDMIMINVSDIDCKEGDPVIVFGKSLSADDFSSKANTISYELLTGISQRVRRKIIK
ncbi:alanine racemase [Kriegella sp. EG-1]|nr:alanine racemase [Flavobacteriaceae bacterium EG-1]